jgi:hypothetical protein
VTMLVKLDAPAIKFDLVHAFPNGGEARSWDCAGTMNRMRLLYSQTECNTTLASPARASNKAWRLGLPFPADSLPSG